MLNVDPPGKMAATMDGSVLLSLLNGLDVSLVPALQNLSQGDKTILRGNPIAAWRLGGNGPAVPAHEGPGISFRGLRGANAHWVCLGLGQRTSVLVRHKRIRGPREDDWGMSSTKSQ